MAVIHDVQRSKFGCCCCVHIQVYVLRYCDLIAVCCELNISTHLNPLETNQFVVDNYTYSC